MRIPKVILLSLLLVTGYDHGAFAADRDMLKEKAIEDKLGEISPPMVEVFRAATVALDEGNLALADSLYTIVYNEVPEFDPMLRRLGQIRMRQGKQFDAVALCKKAVAIDRSAYNLLSLAYCYFISSESSNDKTERLHQALTLLKEAETLPDGDDPYIPYLIGEIALKLNDIDEFRNSTGRLVNNHPDEMTTHYFVAILAAYDGEWMKAKDEILIAEKLGLPHETVESFLDSGVQKKAKRIEAGYLLLWIFVGWIAGLCLLFIIGKLLSNFTMNSLERKIKGAKTSKFELQLRSVYKMMINIGGFYYYFSLPLILFLVIGFAGGLIYLFFMVGHIPIKIMLILIAGALFTIYGMIRSLLVKAKYTDPGRALLAEEAPGLYALTREVADKIATRAVDEIRITVGTDLAVYERGSRREKFQDKATRILIIGTGVLKDFKQSDFKAILAHEYGHFSHRDTAGGEIALRVNNDMSRYFYALYIAEQNVWWNMAFLFLRLYNFIFRRISHGATRLQEVLADRLAAQVYGSLAFRNGLIYVIRRAIEFSKSADSEIEIATNETRPIKNLYELSANKSAEIDEELNKALNENTSEDDTHPSPMDRIRYVEGLNSPDVPADESLVIDLFADWKSITNEMTAKIEAQIRNSS